MLSLVFQENVTQIGIQNFQSKSLHLDQIFYRIKIKTNHACLSVGRSDSALIDADQDFGCVNLEVTVYLVGIQAIDSDKKKT